MPLHLDAADIVLRLIMAICAGAVMGFDREAKNRPAGLRTTILVSMAAAIAMIQMNILFGRQRERSGFLFGYGHHAPTPRNSFRHGIHWRRGDSAARRRRPWGHDRGYALGHNGCGTLLRRRTTVSRQCGNRLGGCRSHSCLGALRISFPLSTGRCLSSRRARGLTSRTSFSQYLKTQASKPNLYRQNTEQMTPNWLMRSNGERKAS
jgi:hypothetical protein